MAFISVVLSGLSAAMAGPRLPPRKLDSRVSSDNPLVGFFSEWQGRQLARSTAAPSCAAAAVARRTKSRSDRIILSMLSNLMVCGVASNYLRFATEHIHRGTPIWDNERMFANTRLLSRRALLQHS